MDESSTETTSAANSENNHSVSSDTPADQPQATQDQDNMPNSKQQRGVLKEHDENESGDDSRQLPEDAACDNQVTTASDSQEPEEALQESMSSITPEENKYIGPDNETSQGDGPDNETSQGDGPDNEMSQGDGPDNETSQGDGPDNETSQGDGPDNETSQGDGPDNEMSQGDGPDNETSQGDGPDNETSQGDGPDNETSQGDGPDNETSQGDGPDNETSQGDGPDNETSQGDGQDDKEEIIHDDDVSIGADDDAEVTCKKRNKLYEKGQKLFRLGENEAALKCFLQSLKGLEQHNTFTFLPQCLRSIADIYYKQEEYEKAVQFIQAEKMFYETSLIDTSTREKLLEDRCKEKGDGGEENEKQKSSDPNADNPDALRADEFEKLARLCLQKNQSQLALEYQGKATKLRKKVYGENSQVTMKSLDFFTVVYGEVGKQQYSESMERITASSGGDTGTDAVDDMTLRHRATAQPGREAVIQPTDVSGVVEDTREREEWVSRVVLWILFLLCIGCLSVLMFYLYCKLDVTSRSCDAWKADMNYHWMRVKYLYYSYVGTAKNKLLGSG